MQKASPLYILKFNYISLVNWAEQTYNKLLDRLQVLPQQQNMWKSNCYPQKNSKFRGGKKKKKTKNKICPFNDKTDYQITSPKPWVNHLLFVLSQNKDHIADIYTKLLEP